MGTQNLPNKRRSAILRVETFQLGCSGCKPDVLNNSDIIRRMLKKVSSLANLTPIFCKIHPFPSQGLTGYIILAESHIAIHTWPEYGFATLDIQTCKARTQLRKVISHIKRTLCARKIKTTHTKLVKRF